MLDVIVLLDRHQFGPSADRLNKDQSNLFDEAELERLLADLETPEPIDAEPTTQAKTQRKPKQPVRRPLPAHLKRVEKIIDPCDEDKAAMGKDWTFIGYDTSKQLAIICRCSMNRVERIPSNPTCGSMGVAYRTSQ